MTTGLALSPPAWHAPARAGRAVIASWRRLTTTHWGLALAGGLVVGLAEGLGDILALKGVWWHSALPTLGLRLALAVWLLLCIAVAACVETKRVPKWVPFVAAAFGATLLTLLSERALVLFLERVAGLPSYNGGQTLLVFLWTNAPRYLLITILVALGCMQGLDAMRRQSALRGLQIDRARVAREAYEARLQALQARIEPRFLFDTLAAVAALYESDPPQAQRMLDDLIVYLRTALPRLDRATSTLAAELTLARTWLDIMRIRDAAGPSFSVDPAPAGIDALLPPMIVLPLVQHAAGYPAHPRGSQPAIAVTARVADGRVRIAIASASPAFADEPSAAAVVRTRLQALYGAAAALVLRTLDTDASEAVLEIPHELTDRDHR
jgi:hypothetical protein